MSKNENYINTIWPEMDVWCVCGGKMWTDGGEFNSEIKICPECGQVYYVKLISDARVATWFDKLYVKLLDKREIIERKWRKIVRKIKR